MEKSITILGAGPVGSLLAIYMAKRGYDVSVYDKREDPRKTMQDDGRSINLALSHRGIHALEKAGLGKRILESAIPMRGRMIHDEKGNLNFQQYGEQGQFINSISRGGLNRMLIEVASKEHGIHFHFNEKCLSVDFEANSFEIENYQTKEQKKVTYTVLAGCDGAFSQARKHMELQPNHRTVMDKLSHGYKELTIPATKLGVHQMEPNALHIWPRGDFMLIALPNKDGSFTCTLFLPFTGKHSFENIKNESDLNVFFQTFFPDALPLIESVSEEYFSVEASFLATLNTFPWTTNNAFLIGDAAHAMVPFYGQGMNAGFEDVRLLNEILEKHQDDWSTVLPEYEKDRKPNGDAISALALRNFVEMSDLVDDENFILRKKIEAKIHQQIPAYLPLYSMVTFSDIPYSEALQKGEAHDRLMEEILKLPNISANWNTTDGWLEIKKVLDRNLY